EPALPDRRLEDRTQRLHRLRIPARRSPRMDANTATDHLGSSVAGGANAVAHRPRLLCAGSAALLPGGESELRLRGAECLRAWVQRPARERADDLGFDLLQRLRQAKEPRSGAAFALGQ